MKNISTLFKWIPFVIIERCHADVADILVCIGTFSFFLGKLLGEFKGFKL
jgi:hypothetical protein